MDWQVVRSQSGGFFIVSQWQRAKLRDRFRYHFLAIASSDALGHPLRAVSRSLAGRLATGREFLAADRTLLPSLAKVVAEKTADDFIVVIANIGTARRVFPIAAPEGDEKPSTYYWSMLQKHCRELFPSEAHHLLLFSQKFDPPAYVRLKASLDMTNSLQSFSLQDSSASVRCLVVQIFVLSHETAKEKLRKERAERNKQLDFLRGHISSLTMPPQIRSTSPQEVNNSSPSNTQKKQQEVAFGLTVQDGRSPLDEIDAAEG